MSSAAVGTLVQKGREKARVRLLEPCLSLCVCVSAVQSALAQAPEIGGLLPSGGPRSAVTTVRVDGKNLQGAKIYVNGGGITLKSQKVNSAGDQLTADFAVEPYASLGPRDVRIATAKGVSNGARFWVDVRPNRVIEKPMADADLPIELDGSSSEVINGRIAAKASRDRFALTAAAGDTWAFDCYADRIRSRFDPVLELTDSAGISVKLVQSTWESDPRFCYTFKRAGRYLLTVRDSEYNGGPNYVYRLAAYRGPFLSGYLPRGDRPGRTVDLGLEGTNLPARHVQVPIPAYAQPGEYWTALPMGGTACTMVALDVQPEPVIDAGASTGLMLLSALPVIVDGVFERAPVARFTFAASKGHPVVFDVLGRRIGSRIDSEVRVFDGTGKQLAENDDADVLTKDSHLEFSPPADGGYTVEVRNVEEVTGPDCFYRLCASPVVPDFRVSIAVDRLSAPVGGTTALSVHVDRLGGFSGPVEVRVEGLPLGMTSSGAIVGPGKSDSELTLTAAPNAAVAAGSVRVIGAAQIDSTKVEHEAPAWERYEHRSIDLLLSVEYSYTRPHHLWDMLLAAVTERVDAITVSPALGSVTIAPGGKIEIPITVARQPKADGEIKLELRGLPAKLTATAAPISAGQTETRIVLTATADATPDVSNLIVTAKLGNAQALARAIRVTIQKTEPK